MADTAHIFETYTSTKFKYNGIPYLKNYVSAVNGNRVIVFNCYEERDVLVELSQFDVFDIDGVVYESAIELQEALTSLTYKRTTLSGGAEQDLAGVTEIGATTTIPMTVNDGTDKLTHSAKALIYGKNDGGYTLSVEAATQTGNYKVIYPVLDENKTPAFVEDLPAAQGLQSVTDVDNTTTNGIIIGDGFPVKTTYGRGGIFHERIGGNSVSVGFTHPSVAIRSINFPDADGTIALQEYVTNITDNKADITAVTKNIHIDVTDSTAITGVTTDQIAKYFTIPANATSAGVLSISATVLKPLSNGACNVYIYKLANTSDLTGATKMATMQMASAAKFCQIERQRIRLSGSQASMLGSAVLTNTDVTNSGSNPTVITFDSTVSNIIGIVVQNASAADATTVSNFNIKFDKAI